MAELLKVLLLALVQGVTEILPVSSSGHLVVLKEALGLDSPGLQLEAILHGGSLAAILLFYRRRLLAMAAELWKGEGGARVYAGTIVLGCLPAVGVGLLWKDWIEAAFDSPRAAAAGWVVTALFLLLASGIGRPCRKGPVGVWQALGVGLAQVLALWPGVSRSGSTISAGRLAGMEEGKAAEFSFFMAIPLLAGVLCLALVKIASGRAAGGVPLGHLALGFVVTAISGYGAMALLHRVLAGRRLWVFGLYCLVAAVLVFVGKR